jgi:hypothetical protein
MLSFDRRIGKMAKRNFRNLEVLESAEQGGSLPPGLIEGDAIGGRIACRQDDPPVVVLGRLAFYVANESGENWRVIPFDSIVDTDYGTDKGEWPTRLDITMANGEVERLYTSELSGILGVIHRKAQNYCWTFKPTY